MDHFNHTVFDCHIIDFTQVDTEDGNITVVENNNTRLFDVKRIFYLYDIPGGANRGAHAHRILEQLIIAGSGSFDVIIDDGKYKKRVSLNRPHLGLHIKPGIWTELDNFSSGSICLVLASHTYDEKDYLRDYEQFKILKTI